MQYLRRVVSTAVRALMKNTSRSVLTMLGIVIGVAAVITMQAVGTGTKEDVSSEIASLGVNLIVVTPSAAIDQGVRFDAGSARIFKRRHAQGLVASCPSVSNVSAFMMAPAQLKYQSENWRTSVVGADSGYFAIRNLQVKRGSTRSESALLWPALPA